MFGIIQHDLLNPALWWEPGQDPGNQIPAKFPPMFAVLAFEWRELDHKQVNE